MYGYGDSEDEEDEGIKHIPLVFTTDNAPAMVAALDGERDWHRVPCFAHVTALCVNAANKVKAVKKWKQHVTNIVGHFKHSAQHLDMLHKLRDEAGKSKLNPIQEGATRWLSTHGMLERFSELKQEII